MKAANTMEVRQQNALGIMKDIECFPGITIAEIARDREVSVATVSNIVNLLKAGEWIRAEEAAVSSGGRRPVQLTVNADYQTYLGIGVGKHTVYMVLADFAGKVLESEKYYRGFSDSDEYWSGIAALSDVFALKAPGPYRKGIALPGFVDENQGIVSGTDLLGVSGVRLKSIYDHFGDDISVGDASVLAGLSQTFGHADYPDSFYILLSRRISGFLIRNNEPVRKERIGLDIGTMILDPHGTTSDYGAPGSFLELCSSSRIIDILKKNAEDATYETFFRDIEEGNEEYRSLWDEYLTHLALALHNLRAAYGFGLVIGGEMAGYLGAYAEELKQKAEAFAPGYGRYLHITFSACGRYDEAYGAALAARHEHVTELIPSLMKGAASHTVQRKRRRSAS